MKEVLTNFKNTYVINVLILQKVHLDHNTNNYEYVYALQISVFLQYI